MIGGAPVNRAYADEIGAEGFADDCVTAIDEAKRLMTLK
jgi:5-methyltetrahydrofolate--homocysteine methyltransferase